MGREFILSRVSELEAEFTRLEREYRIENSKALDIDDVDEAARVQVKTFNSIRVVKEWKTEILKLKKEIEESEIFEKKVLTTMDNSEIEDDYKEDVELKERVYKEEKNSESIILPVQQVLYIKDAVSPLQQITIQDIIEDGNLNTKKETLTKVDVENIKVIVKDEIADEREQGINEDSGYVTLLIRGKEYKVKTYNDALVTICEFVISSKPFKGAKLDRIDDINKEKIISSFDNTVIYGKKKRLTNGLFLSMEVEEYECKSIIETILKVCNLENEAMII